MGVLMSKKQPVDKVQRCTAVVSAFQAGLKDRAAVVKPADGEAEDGEVPAKTSTGPEEKNAEEEEGGQTESPSTSQQAPRDECKVNQEAWSRLRDGKGVEPEDLEKSHQLTPPAFVRPKREADDDQPSEVELAKKEQDNLNLLLTEEEMYSLMETFKQCKIIPESCLVSDELLQYHHFVSKQQFDKDLTDEQEEEVLSQFAALDPDKKGHIEWPDFLYFESLAVLRKFRTENSLVRLLTAKERDTARSVFLGLDLDKDGLITKAECRQAQQSWFNKLNKDSQSCNVSISHVGPICESSPASSGSERSKTDDNRPTTWADFLRESSIYILAARPNSSAMHIRLPL
uniref:PHD finger protein 24 isoform X2 n=1 Tax=Doryrhamphus excisus TaxID=161450 RepID=UPI0025AE9974|nr:PHD finger protein 24 isoform X2 [Doryrhamphus excisus]